MTTGAITPSPAILLAQQQAAALVNNKAAEPPATLPTLGEVEGSSLSKEENLTITGNQRHLLMQKLSRERAPEVFSSSPSSPSFPFLPLFFSLFSFLHLILTCVVISMHCPQKHGWTRRS